MKKSGIIALSALLFASTSLSAFAEGPQQGHDDQHQQQPVKRPPQGGNQQGENQHGGQPQGNQHGAQPQHASGHREPQHKQPQHNDFHQGRPLPQKYRGEGYQVNDWHKRGLKAPPAGHRWQNVDGNYVLIAIGTGVIASIIAHQ